MSIILNEEQSKIVQYEGDKFLSVQAGPGSGKNTCSSWKSKIHG